MLGKAHLGSAPSSSLCSRASPSISLGQLGASANSANRERSYCHNHVHSRIVGWHILSEVRQCACLIGYYKNSDHLNPSPRPSTGPRGVQRSQPRPRFRAANRSGRGEFPYLPPQITHPTCLCTRRQFVDSFYCLPMITSCLPDPAVDSRR